METKFNKEQVCGLDERALVNAFEVEELEKRYEMGWIKHGTVTATISTDFKGDLRGEAGTQLQLF